VLLIYERKFPEKGNLFKRLRS